MAGTLPEPEDIVFWNKERGPREIEVSITCSQVGNISTTEETMSAKLWIDVYWKPSRGEYDAQQSEWDMLNNFQLMNGADIIVCEVRREPVMKEVGDRVMWHGVLEVIGSFRQNFNLQAFPLDGQQCAVRFEMGNVKDMVYRPVRGRDVVFTVESDLSTTTGWQVIGTALSFTGTDPALSKQGNSYAQLVMTIKVLRSWKPYIWRVALFTAFIDFSAILTFVIPAEDVADRLGFIFGLVLTTVAFQYTVQDSLPHVDYTTFLERYILFSTLLLFGVACAVGTIKGVLEWESLYGGNDGSEAQAKAAEDHRTHMLRVDSLVAWGFLGILGVMHLYGIVHCVWERARQRHELERQHSHAAPKNNLKVKRESRCISPDGRSEVYCNPAHHIRADDRVGAKL